MVSRTKATDESKQRTESLDFALGQIEKQYGKGAITAMADHQRVIPARSQTDQGFRRNRLGFLKLVMSTSFLARVAAT